VDFELADHVLDDFQNIPLRPIKVDLSGLVFPGLILTPSSTPTSTSTASISRSLLSYPLL